MPFWFKDFLATYAFVSALAWLVVRLSVTVLGNLIGYLFDQELPLGSGWMNWLCVGLGLIGGAAYLIVTRGRLNPRELR